MPSSTLPLVLLLLAALAAPALSQTADDDEVDAAYPGYPHTFYSGNSILIKAIL